MHRLSALGVIALATIGVAPGLAQDTAEHFLFSQQSSAVRPQGCSSDPLGFAQNDSIRRAIDLFGLSGARIKFLGCTTTEFQTSAPPGIDDDDLAFKIYYPVTDALQPRDYVAPLIHELGHAFQIKQVGSIAELKRLESRRIELGADFLAGLVFGKSGEMKLAQFHASTELIGRYREKSNEHGTPEQRGYAFRFGVFFEKNHGVMNVEAANAQFQRDDFAKVIELFSR